MSIFEVFLAKKELISTQTFQLTLKFSAQTSFEFKPGQYIWLCLPKLDFADLKGERRTFSITSSPSDRNQITILVKTTESGYNKTLQNLPENSQLQLIGPFGSSYTINPDLIQNIVMIAGGVGISPFASILRFLQYYPSHPKLQVIYCSTSSENTQIKINLNLTENDVTIAVEDQGIGIPESAQSKIFTKLYRADNAKSKVSDGIGLGLYLAKMIIDQSGGKVWFESPVSRSANPDEEGQKTDEPGTIFYFKLPLSGMIKKVGTKALS